MKKLLPRKKVLSTSELMKSDIFRGGIDIHRAHEAASVISKEGGVISHRGPYQVLMDHHGHIAIRTSLPEDTELSLITLTNSQGIHIDILSPRDFAEGKWAAYHYPLTRVAEKYLEYATDWAITRESLEHLEIILGRKANRDKIRLALEEMKDSVESPASERPEGGISLKEVCFQAKIDPRLARRILRARGKKPSGRWEWSAAEAPQIIELLKQHD